MHSYAYALIEVGKYDNWSLKTVKVKEDPRSRTAKVSGRRKIYRIDKSLCRNNDVIQNVFSALEDDR